MQLKRISDDAVVEAIHVATLIAAPEGSVPEPWAGFLADGSLVRAGDNVRVVDPTTGLVLASTGLGDTLIADEGRPVALSERALLRGYDPV